ncbi:MAG: T9SS type A sorting domain-containing protein [Bacteroidota bacterium]
MKKLFDFLLFIFLLLPVAGISQSAWYQVNTLPDGGSVKDMATDAKGNLYVLTYFMSNIFYSSDNGINWTEIPGTFSYWNITDIELDKSTGTLYVGTLGKGLFWTTNKGLTWSNEPFYTLPTSGDNAFINKVTRKATTGIIVCNEPGLFSSTNYTSTNAGLTWKTNAAAFVSAYELQYMEWGTLLAGTENGIYKSFDNGISWVLANTGIAGLKINSIVQKKGSHTIFAAASFNYLTNDTSACGIYTSIDSGQTWVRSSKGITDIRMSCIVSDSAAAMLYASSFGGIYQSADNGANWTSVSSGLDAIDFTTIALNTSGVFSGNMQSGVAYAAAPASGWSYRNNGMTNSTIGGFSLNDNGEMCLIDNAHSGVYKSKSGSWSQMNTGLPSALGTKITEDKSGRIYASFLQDSTGLYRSTDRGVSWSNIATMAHPADLRYTVFSPLKADAQEYLYTIAEYSASTYYPPAVFRSTDHGLSWKMIYEMNLFSFIAIRDIDIATDSTIYITLTNFFGEDSLIYSVDGGLSFNGLAIDIPPPLLSINLSISHDDSLYLCNNNHVYKYKGLGHWAQLPDGPWDADFSFHPIRLYLDTADKLYITCKGFGVFFSENDGISWKDISTGLPLVTPPFSISYVLAVEDIQFDSTNTPYALATEQYAGAHRGVYKWGISTSASFSQAKSIQALFYPNPVSDKGTLHCYIENPGQASVHLYQNDGKLVRHFTQLTLQKGPNEISIEMQGLPPGIYRLKILDKGQSTLIGIHKQ